VRERPLSAARFGRSFWVTSLAVHVALAAVVLPATLGRARVASWLGITLDDPGSTRAERVRFVQTAEPKPEVVANGRDRTSGGDAAPPAPVLPVEAAPAEVPTDVPAATGSATGTDAEAKGDGSGGPLDGIRPSFQDPRLWSVPWGPTAVAEKPSYEAVKQRINELIRDGRIPKEYQDSVSKVYGIVAGNSGDWTVGGRGNERWGMDGQFIRLGKIAIPTVLLALLPLNQPQINVQQFENQRRLGQMSADIRYQAQRAMNEDEFRAAVRRVRERRDREREEERKRRDAETKPVVPVQP
jgi:hypothetical protein